MRRYLVELIGTFFLVLTIGMTVVGPQGAGPFAPVAIGAMLMVMVYAGGHVSGAHYNPAVTLGVAIRGKCPWPEVPLYWAAQVAGAALAAILVSYLKGTPEPPTIIPATGPAFASEFLFTFALVWVVLNVATSKDTAGNSNYGLAIGFTVMAGAFAVGGVSGGVFNPAVAVGITMMNVLFVSKIWIYFAAELLAAVAAAAVFRFANPEDC